MKMPDDLQAKVDNGEIRISYEKQAAEVCKRCNGEHVVIVDGELDDCECMK